MTIFKVYFKKHQHNALRIFLIVVTCSHIQPTNGLINDTIISVQDQYTFGTIILFSCNPGYNLNVTGSSFSATCLESGNWNSSMPECNPGF